MSIITTIEQLEQLYDHVGASSTVKVASHITPQYRVLIEKSPFAALATRGAEGLDCSPRGDLEGVVRVHDDTTLMMPDRRGNNRLDSLRNIVRDPQVALLFLIPGSGTTLRINGEAVLSVDPDVLASFKVDGKPPRSSRLSRCARFIFNARGRSCGPIFGIPPNTSIRRHCPHPVRYWRR